MIPTRINTGKYKIPLKLRKDTSLHNKLPRFQQPVAGELTKNDDINTEEINDVLEMINDNYDTFKTIFTAPDDINVNKEIKQETAGMLLKLFQPKNQRTAKTHFVDPNTEPIHLPEYEFKKWPRDLATYIHSAVEEYAGAFDEVEYNKNRGEWKNKNINDFKKLFD